MKANKTISLDVDVMKDLIEDVGEGNVSGWIEEQAKKLHESLEMEKKVIPRAEGTVIVSNNPNKPLLVIGAKQTTLDIFNIETKDISKNLRDVEDLPLLYKVMRNSKLCHEIARTRIRKLK